MVRQRTVCRFAYFFRVRCQFARLPDGFLARLPIAEPALFPFRSILFADFASGKISGQHALRVGQTVQPTDEVGSEFAIGQATIELLANLARQPRYFSITCHECLETNFVGRLSPNASMRYMFLSGDWGQSPYKFIARQFAFIRGQLIPSFPSSRI
jgi:hypothetical protein